MEATFEEPEALEDMTIRTASFALRVVRRRMGNAAILYRRTLNKQGLERLTKVALISPIAFSAAASLLRAGVRASGGSTLAEGPFHPLDMDYGARIACYALVASGLRNADRLYNAAEVLRNADGTEAAWWFGLMTSRNGKRALRAMRILTEAVK